MNNTGVTGRQNFEHARVWASNSAYAVNLTYDRHFLFFIYFILLFFLYRKKCNMKGQTTKVTYIIIYLIIPNTFTLIGLREINP